MLYGLGQLVEVCANVGRPLLIAKLIDFAGNEEATLQDGLILASLLLVVVVVGTYGMQAYFKGVSRVVERVGLCHQSFQSYYSFAESDFV